MTFQIIERLSETLSQWIIQQQEVKENSMKFGGQNTLIELDESCFFKGKNYKGRLLKNIWVFEFVERRTDRFVAQEMEKRDAKTRTLLLEVEFLETRNFWRYYLGLQYKNYKHRTIQHKKQFVVLKKYQEQMGTDQVNDAKKR